MFAASTLCFCDVDTDAILDQEEDIEDYLDDKDIDYDDLDGVYRYVPNSDRADYATSNVISKGDLVTYYFESYTFSYGPSELIYSNKDYLIAEQVEAGLSADSWSSDAIEAVIGTTNLLKGVTKGLVGCHEGDSVVLIMTSDYAYGDKVIGTVEGYTPIMYIATIETVKNN